MPANRMRAIAKNRRHVYHRLRAEGKSKRSSARLSNAGRTKAGRRRMARKAARTRARRR
jgi:hypothetical protein